MFKKQLFVIILLTILNTLEAPSRAHRTIINLCNSSDDTTNVSPNATATTAETNTTTFLTKEKLAIALTAGTVAGLAVANSYFQTNDDQEVKDRLDKVENQLNNYQILQNICIGFATLGGYLLFRQGHAIQEQLTDIAVSLKTQRETTQLLEREDNILKNLTNINTEIADGRRETRDTLKTLQHSHIATQNMIQTGQNATHDRLDRIRSQIQTVRDSEPRVQNLMQQNASLTAQLEFEQQRTKTLLKSLGDSRVE